MLLRDDGAAVAMGADAHGQTAIPACAEGWKYTAVAAGYAHTVPRGQASGAAPTTRMQDLENQRRSIQLSNIRILYHSLLASALSESGQRHA